MKKICKVKVANRLGIHARPASTIVRLIQESQSDVWFTYKKQTVNAKSIMSLLTLAAVRNSLITIEAEGDDADEVLGVLKKVFEERFGEE